MALDRQEAPAQTAARIGAVEHRVVLGPEVRRALDCHGAAHMEVGGVDLAPRKAKRGEHIEVRLSKVLGREAQLRLAEVLAERPLVEGEFDIEGGWQRLLKLLDDLRRKGLGL